MSIWAKGPSAWVPFSWWLPSLGRSCLASHLGLKPAILVTGAPPHYFSDLWSFRVPRSPPSLPTLARSFPPSPTPLRAFRSLSATQGWNVQDDTQRVEIFMNELCWMNFSLCVQANKSVNEAENSCNWLMVSGVLGSYPIKGQLDDSCTINILN